MDIQNKIVGNIGRKGSGKSTILKAVVKRQRRLFIFDTMGEHDFVVDTITDPYEVRSYLEEIKPEDSFHARFIPCGEIMDEFDVVADAVYDNGSMTFCIEELPMLTKSPSYMQPSLGRVFRLGRHRALDICWSAQRAAEVPRGVTQATDVFIFFQQTEPGDLDAITKRCGSECASVVSGLALHDFVIFDVITRTMITMDQFKNTKEMANYFSHILSGTNSIAEQSNYKTQSQGNRDIWKGINYGNHEQ